MKIKTRTIPLNKPQKYSVSYSIGVTKMYLKYNKVPVSEYETINLNECTIINISSGNYDPYSENKICRGSWYLGVRI